MSIWKSDEEIYQDGYEDGKNAGFLDSLAHNIGNSLPVPDTSDDAIYERGWKDGVNSKD